MIPTNSGLIIIVVLIICLSITVSALRDIKHEARGRDANKARGEAECFISIEAACPCPVLYVA